MSAKGKMTDADRRAQLIALWLELPAAERTYETGPMNFYQWVRDNRPDLLVDGPGDYPYQCLRNDIFGNAN
jgi:hypothetical protein